MFFTYKNKNVNYLSTYNLKRIKKDDITLSTTESIYITVDPINGKIEFETKTFNFSVENLEKNKTYRLALDIPHKDAGMEC